MPAPHRIAGRVAASTRTRVLIAGPRLEGRVLGVFDSAVYVGFGAAGGSDMVALEAADGLRLPRAATLAAHSSSRPFATIHAGDEAQVGQCRLEVGPLTFDVVRWWSPRRPRAITTLPYDGARLAAVLRLLPALPREIDDRLGSLASALETGGSGDVRHAVTALLGLGAGLTPQGDDVLAGLLVSLAAVPRARPLARQLGAVVTSEAATRTTSLSAALLRDAADGFAVPALVAFVDALPEVNHPGDATTHPSLADVVLPLLAVGHSSGAALAHGAVAAARLHAGMPARGGGA